MASDRETMVRKKNHRRKQEGRRIQKESNIPQENDELISQDKMKNLMDGCMDDEESKDFMRDAFKEKERMKDWKVVS